MKNENHIRYVYKGKQKVAFTVAGYDDDRRELIEIPEVIAFCKALINKYPCFWYYAAAKHALFVLLCMVQKNYIAVLAQNNQRTTVDVKPEKLMNALDALQEDLVKYCEKINDENGIIECYKAWADSLPFKND